MDVLSSVFYLVLVTIFISEGSAYTVYHYDIQESTTATAANRFFAEIQVHNTTQNYHYCCDFNLTRGSYTANSTYHTNLNTLLSTLSSNTDIEYGFYSSSYGENADKVYAMGLCRGDLKPDECRSCLDGSRANLTELCPNQKEAIGWYEDEKCMLRYSNRSIFNLLETVPAFYAHNEENATHLDQFSTDVNTLLKNLTSQAASGDSQFKYASGNISGPEGKVIYGLVQCTPDLVVRDCNSCLAQSIDRIPLDCCKDSKGDRIPLDCCKDIIGGRVVRPSCNMRFETSYPFYGTTAYSPSSEVRILVRAEKSNIATVIIAITVSVVVVVAAVLIFYFIRRRVRKSRKKFETQKEAYYDDDDDDDDEIDISESLQFSLNTIRDATNDFSDSNKLGQGGFGAVYKGRLINGQEIAVKRLSRHLGQGEREFKNEVLLVAKLQHRNLVRLVGFCLEGRERLIVYEFVPNKSLDYFIFDQTKRAQLDWEKRYKIIAGTARGILYLHQDSRLRIIHRDLKASNILLDEDMNPKIADFGLARLFVVDQTHADTNRVVGTYGYMAPEYAMHGQFSEKSDVFSFGVLVLEVVSGQKNCGIRRGEDIDDLLSFAWRSWRDGRATDIMDPTLNNSSRNEIMKCIHIGLLCVQDNVSARPTMASVVLVLNSHCLTLPIPLEPAFYVDSRTGNLPSMQIWENNSETRSNEEYLTQESVNEASITEPYAR